MPPPHELVLVKWLDSVFVHMGWDTADEYRNEHHTEEMASVGWLLDEKPDSVMLVMTVGPKTVADSLVIPRGSITSISSLTPRRVKRDNRTRTE